MEIEKNYLVQRKKDKLFYNSVTMKWEERMDKARVFKKFHHITAFLRHEHHRLFSVDENGKGHTTLIKDVTIVAVELKPTTDKEMDKKFEDYVEKHRESDKRFDDDLRKDDLRKDKLRKDYLKWKK